MTARNRNLALATAAVVGAVAVVLAVTVPNPSPSPQVTATPTPTPTATATAVLKGSAFSTRSLPTTLTGSAGTTQACDLKGQTGIRTGTDVPISFTSGGKTYKGCYSINFNPGATPAGGGKRPAVFVFGPGLPRKASTSAEVVNAGNPPQGVIAQGKKAGWDMIYIGMFKFTDGQFGWRYNQVYADYADAVAQDLIATRNTDPKRMYAFGSSAGGRIPTFLACHVSDRFAAVVAQGATMSGDGVSTTANADRCNRPPQPVSILFSFADKAFQPDGSPPENYKLHTAPPTDTSISANDQSQIITGRPGQIYYSMLHIGELWAEWQGCAAKQQPMQTLTVGIAPNTSAQTKLYTWTGCRDQVGGQSGEVQVYILPGSHGIEPRVQDDGRAFAFLKRHTA